MLDELKNKQQGGLSRVPLRTVNETTPPAQANLRHLPSNTGGAGDAIQATPPSLANLRHVGATSPPPAAAAVQVPTPAPPAAASVPSPTASSGARSDVSSGVELMMLRKAQEDLLGQWEKKYAEKKVALKNAWTQVSTTLAGGGEPSANSFERLRKHLTMIETLQQQAVSGLDSMMATMAAMSDEIVANREQAALELALMSRPRVDSVPPPPPPSTAPLRTSKAGPPPLPAGYRVVKTRHCVAQFDYAGGHRADEILFKEGERIELVDDRSEPGWWKGRLGDVVGWFPAAYVEVEPDQ